MKTVIVVLIVVIALLFFAGCANTLAGGGKLLQGVGLDMQQAAHNSQSYAAQ